MAVSFTDSILNGCFNEWVDLQDFATSETEVQERLFNFMRATGFFFIPAHIGARGKRPLIRWKGNSRRFIDDPLPFIEWDRDGINGAPVQAYMIDCERSGLVVIDCDTDKETGNPVGDANFLAVYGDLVNKLDREQKLFAVQTPSGGHHYYFLSGTPCQSCAGKLFDHVDVRSRGGLIVCPYSRNLENFKLYMPVSTPNSVCPLPESIPPLPDSLSHALAALESKAGDSAGGLPLIPARHDSLWAAVRNADCLPRAISKIRAAVKGTRNQTLSRQAWHVFMVWQRFRLPLEDAFNSLLSAGISAGLSAYEVRKTLQSAMQSVKSRADFFNPF